MRIYLSGPMRGLPRWNREAFDSLEVRWREAGHQPFSPASLFRSLGYSEESGEERGHCLHAIQLDLACIYAADAIALLPGWEESRGVAVELALALFLKLPVYDAVTMQLIQVKDRPWSNRQSTVVSSSQEDPAYRSDACKRCNGSGYHCGVTLLCGLCNGTGQDPKAVCGTCKGSGYEPGGCHGAPCSQCG